MEPKNHPPNDINVFRNHSALCPANEPTTYVVFHIRNKETSEKSLRFFTPYIWFVSRQQFVLTTETWTCIGWLNIIILGLAAPIPNEIFQAWIQSNRITHRLMLKVHRAVDSTGRWPSPTKRSWEKRQGRPSRQKRGLQYIICSWTFSMLFFFLGGGP